MFKRLFTGLRTLPTRLLLFVALPGCLVWLALTFFRGPAPVALRAVQASNAPDVTLAPKDAPRKLEGEGARVYLEQTSEGQSLMKALETERFGLKWQEHAPFRGESGGGGYLGMSHDENLNAWFDKEGATIRPTVSEKERDKSWRLNMRLKAYGYGSELHRARGATSHTVKENRIEYERGSVKTGRVVEWYVNKSEGVEQGFTFEQRPGRKEGVAESEPLRLVVSVTGDLRARATDEGQSVELSKGSEGVLSYSHLVALDAAGRKLAARMETNPAGDEIALVVDDGEAQYPIVVDPITATQKQELSAGSTVQAEARFGFAVAIEGSLAVVGAWREDKPSGIVDAGNVYTFTRSGNNWVQGSVYFYNFTGASCGWGVAISGDRIVYGCPGADNNKGRVFIVRYGDVTPQAIDPGAEVQAGDRYGESVAIAGNHIAVGAPSYDKDYFGGTITPNSGAVVIFVIDSNLNPTLNRLFDLSGENYRLGTSVDIDARTPEITIIAGIPGALSDRGQVMTMILDLRNNTINAGTREASDGAPGDQFGNSVALDDDTLVVGAPLDDNERGADAGAAYVFARQSGSWIQQQKLLAGDGRAGDVFSEHAVAVEGNTIVVGAYANGTGGDPLNGIDDDNRGAAYVFTRSGTVWTQQTKISQNNFQGGEAGDHFGIDVDISGRDVLIGARGASAGSTLRAGAAFVYELDCVPPYQTRAAFVSSGFPSDLLYCPGFTAVFFVPASTFTTPVSYQWRKNGSNIPGATGSQYTVSNISAADAGSYDVIITNACGSEISTPATLRVVTYSLNPTSQNFSSTGSNGIVNVASTGSTCGWTATSNASWITVTSGSSGTGNGTVGFTIAANTGAGQRTGTITIAGQTFTVTQDAATPVSPTAQLSATNYTLNESDGRATVTVTRTGDVSSSATLNYATTDGAGINPCSLFNGIASQRCDYALSIGTLRFAAGETIRTISIPVVDDAYAEGVETFSITLSNPTGVTLGSSTTATITITDNETVTGANPLDTNPFFVRQHYIDFLGREPEPAGLSGWLNVLTNCGVTIAQPCDRIEVSAGFFRSPEFQDRGYFVYRFYSIVGKIPLYGDFMPDFAKVSGFLSAQQLEENKVAFVSEFMTRSDYQTRYGSISDPTAYVTALLQTLGLPNHPGKANWISSLTSGAKTKAQVLREVTESTEVYSKYYTEAFVIMQYFGYLRRSADGSYVHWIDTMNSTGGDYRIMINGFLNSQEYRQRFGN